MVTKCDKFKGKGFDAFLMSQMWDCQEDRERIFKECRYQVVATDMLAAALPALERANLDADFLEALAELYPTCEAFYFQNCGKLFLAEDVRSHQIDVYKRQVEGCKVVYCYREEPDGGWDSGWRFTAGDESEAYMLSLIHILRSIWNR